MAIVRCSRCNARLTGQLGPELPELGAGDTPVERGAWAIDPWPRMVEEWHRGMPKDTTRTVETDPPGSIVVHPDDRLAGALANVDGQSAGCCGLDGCDGPNQRCVACGTVVGTARTDCWTVAEMRFWPDRSSVDLNT